MQLKQIHWVYISAIAFLISAALCVYFIFFGSNIISSDKAILYYLILIPVGFSAAAFLSMAMRSYAKFRGTYLKYNLELSGPIVIFALVVAGGYFVYRNPPNPPIYDLTVYFTSADKKIRKFDGSLIYRNNSLQIQTDIEGGQSTVKRVLKGSSLTLFPEIPGYVLRDSGGYIVPEYGRELYVTLVEDTAFNTKKSQLINSFSSNLSDYVTNAKDFYDVLANNTEQILKYKPDPYNEFVDALERYNKSYTKLNQDIYNYQRIFISDLKVNASLMKSFVRDIESIHKVLFVDYTNTIDPLMHRYLYDDRYFMNQKLGDSIRQMINQRVPQVHSRLDDIESTAKSIQEELPN